MDGLENGRLDDGPMKYRLCGVCLRKEMADDICSACPRAEEGNVVGIATKFGNVMMHPFICKTLVSETLKVSDGNLEKGNKTKHTIVPCAFFASSFVIVSDEGICGEA